MPIRVSKSFFSNKGNNKLFSTSSHDIGHNFFNKFSRDHSYITIKQKRYVPKKFRYTALPNNFISGLGLYQGTMELKDQKLLQGQLRSYNSSITSPLYKRLLRTRRMLVLPAHVNLAVITNSFDVIHSWYVPGLGFKLDCVPGRSTHHSLYIDHCGFYYGQCAEICGRYHHHMPIRVCALPFEHFLI